MIRRSILILWHLTLLTLLSLAMLYHNTSIYLFYQARGQAHILLNTEPADEYPTTHKLTEQQQQNLALVEKIRSYAQDSLGFVPTKSYRRVYDQGQEPILWAITASSDTMLKAYYWHFPLLGTVSYKGFFEKEKALHELNHLSAQGYDVELRPVSAWSTLGWFHDPVLSDMLKMPKGTLCNLLFHELFHSTYYAPGSVEENENLATFIGEKATLQFLKNDTTSLNQYLARKHDSRLFHDYLVSGSKKLEAFYAKHPVSRVQKLKVLLQLANGIDSLPLRNKRRYEHEKHDIMLYKNAYFIGFNQYHKEQDSLETAFNKIYKGNLRNMVLYLKQKSGK
ncbi:MAG: aminopeptidase [Bacteroidetes bacterium]|nr:aminopeptidase [Bacteroidota bacterium]